MSVTTSSYTTNSIQIISNNESTSTNIISAANAAIVQLGWTQYDVITTTAFSPITTYVYRVINADATTYKYFIIRWDTVKLIFYTSTCQSWDTGAHLPTNESWSGAGAFGQSYDILTSSILVSATNRHIMMMNYINGQPGMWSGVWEFERIASEDVAGTPCYAWTNSLMVGTPYGQTVNTIASNMMFAFPITPDGVTGSAAANIYAPVTNRGMFPPSFPQVGIQPGVTSPALGSTDPNLLHLGSYYNVTYGWNSLATVVSPISVDATTKSMPFGRAYNWGVTKPIGAALDTTTVLGDATGGWPSGTGSTTTYLILPMHGGCEADAAYASGKSIITTGTAGTSILGKPIQVGTNIWLAASDGIRTYDINAGQGGTTTLRAPNANGIYDIVYDGQTTVYGSTSNGIVKIDCNTFSTASITTIAAGTGYLGIDQKYVYATSRTASTTPSVYMISRSAFTVNAGAATLGTAVTVATGFGTPVPSYTGTVYVATQSGSASANIMRLASFTADNGTQVATVTNPRNALAVVQTDCPTGLYLDYISNRLFCAVSTATSGSIYEIAAPSMVTAGVVATFGTITGGTLYTNGTYNNVTLTLSSGPAATTYPVVNITVAASTVTAVTLVAGFGGTGVATTTVFTIPNTSIGGSGSGFSIPVSTLATAPTFTTGATGATLQSHMALATTSDYRGDLQFVPFRGTHIITTRQPGRNQASYASKVNFIHPTATTTGTSKQLISTATAITSYPGGYGSAMSSNGVYLVGTNWVAAGNNYIAVASNNFNMTNIGGNQSGRILVKA